jgi:hypothetical protein
MDFLNDTAWSARLARAQLLYKDLLMATVVVKGTFDVMPDGEVRPAVDPIAVSEADIETAFGVVPGDVVPVKSCCDLFVLAEASSPEPVGSIEVSLAVGDFKRALVVFGDRRWERAGATLRPSAPAAFTAMPITYERAFGGAARHTGKLRGPFGDNPAGRGYLVLEEDAEGTALPNVEEADQPIRSWKDTPLPAGLAPLPRDSALRGLRGVTVDLEAQTTRLDPAFFSSAHPRMQMPAYPGGGIVDVRGLRTAGIWQFVLPHFQLTAEVDLGPAHYELPLVVDTLCMLPGAGRFYVVARRALIYQFAERVLRSIRVVERAADPSGRTSTIRDARVEPEVGVPIHAEDATIDTVFDDVLRMNPMTRLTESLPLCPSGLRSKEPAPW